jgi:predicted ATPase
MLKQYISETPDAPQVVFTTHSPYLLSEFEPQEITFMSRQVDGSSRARPLRDAKKIEGLLGDEAFYLGELWYNYNEEVIFGDAQS